MDLPTYTNIWRLERRLYKLYDFRLPMPLPINWIAIFVGITIPYIVLLIAIGLPFNHNLVWLYVLPPGLLTWLTTRPVLESKRLPELMQSQIRYLSEPRTWVRLAPLSEKDEMVLTARVWHSHRPAKRPAKRPARPATPEPIRQRPALPAAAPGRQVGTLRPEPVLKPTSIFRPEPSLTGPVIEGSPARQRPAPPQRARGNQPPQRSRGQERVRGRERSHEETRSRLPLAPPPGGQGQGRRAPALPPSARQFPAPALPPAAPQWPTSPGPVPPGAIPPAAASAPVPAGEPAAPQWPAPARRNSAPQPVAPAERASGPQPTAPSVRMSGSQPVAPAERASGPQPVARPWHLPDLQPSAPTERPAGPQSAAPTERVSGPQPVAPAERGPSFQPIASAERASGPQPVAPAERVSGPQPVAPAWPGSAPRQVPVAQPASPAQADQPAQPAPPDRPSKPSRIPLRARFGAAADPSLEVSHDAPRRRRPAAKPQPAQPPQTPQAAQPPAAPARRPDTEPVQPVPPAPAKAAPRSVRYAPTTPVTPSAEPAPDRPVPPRPLRPVTSQDDASAQPGPVVAAAPQPASPEPVQPQQPSARERPVVESPAAVESPALAEPPAAVAFPALIELPAVEHSAATSPTAHVSVPARQPAVPAKASLAPSLAPAPTRPDQVQPARATEPPAVQPAAPAPGIQEVTDPKRAAIPSIERALSGPSRDRTATGSWGGKVKIVTGNGAAPGPGARDQEAQDRNRARLPIGEPRRILILGCTSGAGQSVTALMTASMLASLREQPVAAVDLHDGTLARYRAPAAWLEELLAGKPPQQIRPSRPDGLHPTPKPSPARLDVVASHEPLRDGDEIKLAVQLNRHYPLTLLDPGAAGLTRLLKITDQLVVVVPANVDAAGALADTRDWLDNNGHAELAMQSITVINGVSRRSLPDVESAESIARGRSRAIVRVPWDDMLPVAAANPSTLRPQTRVAYTALSGVLVAGLAATTPVRKK